LGSVRHGADVRRGRPLRRRRVAGDQEILRRKRSRRMGSNSVPRKFSGVR
jgi:hypothetical protein